MKVIFLAVQADQKAMANLSIRAAKAREMKADQSTTGHQVRCQKELLVSDSIILTRGCVFRHMDSVPLLIGTLLMCHLA